MGYLNKRNMKKLKNEKRINNENNKRFTEAAKKVNSKADNGDNESDVPDTTTEK